MTENGSPSGSVHCLPSDLCPTVTYHIDLLRSRTKIISENLANGRDFMCSHALLTVESYAEKSIIGDLITACVAGHVLGRRHHLCVLSQAKALRTLLCNLVGLLPCVWPVID